MLHRLAMCKPGSSITGTIEVQLIPQNVDVPKKTNPKDRIKYKKRIRVFMDQLHIYTYDYYEK